MLPSRLLHLPGASRAGSTSERVMAHLKQIACSRYAPSCSGPCASASHCCSAGTSGFDRAYGHVLPGPSGVTPGTHSSGTSAHASLSCCLVTLGCSGTLSNTSSACCWPCSQPWLFFFMGSWVPTVAVFLLHGHLARVSSNLLLTLVHHIQ